MYVAHIKHTHTHNKERAVTHCDFPAGWHWNSSAFNLFQCILLLVFPVETKRNQRLRLYFLWSVTFVNIDHWKFKMPQAGAVCWRRGTAEVMERPVTQESLALESHPLPAGEHAGAPLTALQLGPDKHTQAHDWNDTSALGILPPLLSGSTVISPCDHICSWKLTDNWYVMLQRRVFSTHHGILIIKISPSLWKNNLGCGW